jgi:hypothetical protein
MPAGSFTEIGVPYWSKGALLRQGPRLCTSPYYREPTQWEQLALGEHRYVGLMFTIEGEIHYGWLGIQVGSLLIDDFACEQVPGRPILAGDTVPEPAATLQTLTALAVLASWKAARAVARRL